MVFDYTLPPDHPWNKEWLPKLVGRKWRAEFTEGTEGSVATTYNVTVIGAARMPIDMGGGTILRLEAR